MSRAYQSAIILFLVFLQQSLFAQKKIRITCLGNSITAGARLPHPEKNSYPAQLQTMLGSGYEVMNFGVSGKTVIRNNWAAVNGDKVACVYVDAPVLDLKSWPGGKGSSKGDS